MVESQIERRAPENTVEAVSTARATGEDLGCRHQLLHDGNARLRKGKNSVLTVDEMGRVNRGQPKTSRTSQKAFLRAILEKQEYRCAITGVALTPETAVLDHIVPISKGGGALDENNWQIVHMEVNRIKGVLTMDELLEWALLIVKKQAANYT